MACFAFKIIFFQFVSLLLCQCIAAGQKNYAVRVFTTESGLPHNHVVAMAQDKSGYLWVATWDGLSRWNGYEFKNYYHNPDDSTSLAYFQTEDVLVDSANNVWVGSPGFLSKYNRSTDNFTQFVDNFYSHLALDKNGSLWCGSSNGIYYWDNEAQILRRWEADINGELAEIGHFYPLSIKFDNLGRMWVWGSTFGGKEKFFIRRDDGVGPVFDFLGDCSPIRDAVLPAQPTLNIQPFVSQNGDCWIFSNYGTFKLDSVQHTFNRCQNFSFEKDLPHELSERNKKNLNYVSFMSPEMSPIENEAEINRVVENYFIDRQQIVWQSFLLDGGGASGLTRKIPTPKFFKHHFRECNKSGLNAFFPVIKDYFGRIWGGATNVNAYFMETRDGQVEKIVPISPAIWKIGQRPRSFLEDSTGIWIGYVQGLLLYYDFNTHKSDVVLIKHSDLSDRSLPQSFVHLKNLGNNLLIVGYNDIFLFHKKERTLKKLKQFGVDERLNLYSVLQDSLGGWWIGASRSNLFHFSEDFQEVKTYQIGKLAYFNIEDLVEGDHNDLWISMLGGGIAHFDKATGKSKIYTTADGLSNNTCYGMLKDRHGNLWISTNHGISRFNTKTKNFRIFGPEDGLHIDEFNSDNTYQAPDGEMFFSGMGGIVSFYPDSVEQNQATNYTAPLVVEDFKVSGQIRYFGKAIYECDTVVLQKGDNNFKLSFASLDFKNAEKIRYRYRLIGVDRDFVQTDFRNRFLNYVSLLPGEYMLIVEATNRNGEWVSRKTLHVIIPAYFYQNIWFKIFVGVLACLFVVHLIYRYNHRLMRLAREKQDKLRLESLRGQMNPHFIFNSLNSINYFISQNDRLSANRYIADFSRLIRSILGNMANDYVPLEKELESLKDYLRLEHLRFGDKFDYEIEVDPDLDAETLYVSPGIVQPFIENSIWHGVRGLTHRKGLVRIELTKGNVLGAIRCVVSDDGIGRKLSEERKSTLPGKKSRGIAIVMERLSIVNNLRAKNFQIVMDDLFFEREESGTIVFIDIPLES